MDSELLNRLRPRLQRKGEGPSEKDLEEISSLDVPDDEFKYILEEAPKTLGLIAEAAVNGNPKALDAISEQLKRIEPADLLEILKKDQNSLGWIAAAAAKGNPKALDAISEPLKSIKLADLSAILKEVPKTLFVIALAAVNGNLKDLDAISEQLKRIDPADLLEILKKYPKTLSVIAKVSAKGNPKALDAISEQLKRIEPADLLEILKKDQNSLGWIATAAVNGNPKALDAISEALKTIESADLSAILKEAPKTLALIARAAANGNPKALDAISEPLKRIEPADLLEILKKDQNALNWIATAAVNGNPKALDAILSEEIFNLMCTTNPTSMLIQLAKKYKELKAPNLVHHLAQKYENESFIGEQDEEVKKCFFYLSQIDGLLISKNKTGENGYRYKANIEKVRKFISVQFDGDCYIKLKNDIPNLIIDYLIDQWKKCHVSENTGEETHDEVKDLAHLLLNEAVGYYPYPHNSLKVGDLAGYLCLEGDQYDFLNPEYQGNQRALFMFYCESFLKFYRQADNICAFLSLDKEEVIKDHLSVMLPKDPGVYSEKDIRQCLDKVYKSNQLEHKHTVNLELFEKYLEKTLTLTLASLTGQATTFKEVLQKRKRGSEASTSEASTSKKPDRLVS